MTRIFTLALVLLALPGQVLAWEGVVIKVLDGDSLRVRAAGRTAEIRLYGIDAPEYGQEYGNKARQLARRLALHQPVEVEELDRDRYGRIVALVSTGNLFLNREMVRAGLAWHYPKYCRRQPLCGELQELQAEAARERRGLWRDHDPLPPWQWKRKKRAGEGRGDIDLPELFARFAGRLFRVLAD